MNSNYNRNNDYLSESELNFALGGTNLSYEEAKKISIEKGLANSRHGGITQDRELTLEELENVYGNPYLNEELPSRRRR